MALTRQQLLDLAAAINTKLAQAGPADSQKAQQARAIIADLNSDANAMDTLATQFEAADGPTKQQLLATRFDDLLRANATTNRRLALLIEAVVRDQVG